MDKRDIRKLHILYLNVGDLLRHTKVGGFIFECHCVTRTTESWWTDIQMFGSMKVDISRSYFFCLVDPSTSNVDLSFCVK